MLALLQIILRLGLGLAGLATGSLDGQITIRNQDGTDKKDYSDVVVYLADVEAPVRGAPPRATIRQLNKQFAPKVLAIAAGTTVLFPNDDPIEHNVFSHSANADFDLGRFGPGPGKTYTFLKVGVSEIFCNVHKDMVSYVVVAPSSAYAVTSADGSFHLKQLPPGRHRLAIWARFARPRLAEAWVEIPAGAAAQLAFTVQEQLSSDPPHKNKLGVGYSPGYK
jgi:plastocyanin